MNFSEIINFNNRNDFSKKIYTLMAKHVRREPLYIASHV